MAPPKLLLTGATGYIGGTVLTTLLSSSHPAIKELPITVLVRDKARGKALETLEGPRVTSMWFSGLDDSERLRQVASEHDLVIHVASGFHTQSAEALMEGLASRKKELDMDVHYIQTSGTWNLADGALYSNGIITYSDEKDGIFDLETGLEAQDSFPQRATDLSVIAASEDTGVKSYILMPPDVYGHGTGRCKQQSSDPLMDMASYAIANRGPRCAEDGSGEVGHVHVEDLAALYEVLLGKILDEQEPASGRKGIYFCSGGSHVWRDVAKDIGDAAIEFGAMPSSEVTSLAIEEAARVWTGGDQRNLQRGFCARFHTKPEKAKALGWKPVKTDKDWQKWIRECVHTALKESKWMD